MMKISNLPAQLGATRTVMINRVLALSFALLIQACAAPTYRPPSSISTTAPEVCNYQEEHFTAEGTRQEAGYYCNQFLRAGASDSGTVGVGVPSAIGTSGCSLVSAYVKKDGSVVGPFVRCKSYQDSVAYKAVNDASQPAPCVTSYCGPVSVKGYYRKDGTYVRPHTRKR